MKLTEIIQRLRTLAQNERDGILTRNSGTSNAARQKNAEALEAAADMLDNAATQALLHLRPAEVTATRQPTNQEIFEKWDAARKDAEAGMASRLDSYNRNH